MRTGAREGVDLAVDKDSYVRLEFDVRWQSQTAKHREMYLARRCNVWRDIFPPGLEDELLGRRAGDSLVRAYAPGQALAPYRESHVLERSLREFLPAVHPQRKQRPSFGRFYPKGFLLNLPGIHPGNVSPFRVIGLDEASFTADLNHPLALFSLEIKAAILEVADKPSDVGGRLSTWMEEILDRGPGMQARWRGLPTDFWPGHAFSRLDERDDAEFHARPRLVGHIDSQASAFISKEYANSLQPGMTVLDLMSSLESHLPLDMDLRVVGLGMNREELDNNPGLAEAVVHDLNKHPILPFADDSFDAVVCSLSIEYLIRPLEVMRHIGRVLKPGGPCLISFSNRWHAPKAIAIWSELNEFERLGLVQEYLLRSELFEKIETFSRRNWWRPETDRYASRLPASDPVYIISAQAL